MRTRLCVTAAVLLVAGAAFGTAQGHQDDADGGERRDYSSNAPDKTLLNARTAKGTRVALIERQTPTGTCIQLSLNGAGGPEMCGGERGDRPLAFWTERQNGERFVVVGALADIAAVEVTNSRGRTSGALGKARQGRGNVFLVNPSNDGGAAATVRWKAASGEAVATKPLEFLPDSGSSPPKLDSH